MPAPAVIPAPIAYIKIVVVITLVVALYVIARIESASFRVRAVANSAEALVRLKTRAGRVRPLL